MSGTLIFQIACWFAISGGVFGLAVVIRNRRH